MVRSKWAVPGCFVPTLKDLWRERMPKYTAAPTMCEVTLTLSLSNISSNRGSFL